MARRRDNTVFLQDVLSNALIAVLALATVSMIQIAIGGIERFQQATAGPDPHYESEPSKLAVHGQPDRPVRIQPPFAKLWVLADLPAGAPQARFQETQGARGAMRHWTHEAQDSDRRTELWDLDLEPLPVTDEVWTLELDGPLAPGEEAKIVVLVDDRLLTESDGFAVEGGPLLLQFERPLQGSIRLRGPG